MKGPLVNSDLRVVFMGTPEFAVPSLVALAHHYSIVGVYTQPDREVGRGLELRASPVKRKALELSIPVYQPLKLSQPGEFEKLQSIAPDVIVVVAYGQILKKNVLDLPRLGCVNVHSSLLPRWRGAAPIQWAILEGDRESGVTTMKMAEGLDSGDLYLQKSTPLTEFETGQSLHDRLAQLGAELIVPTLEGLAAGSLRGRPQDPALVTLARKLDKGMEHLSLSLPAEQLDRQIRALSPWPGTSVMVRLGSAESTSPFVRLKIKEARLRRDLKGEPGRLIEHAGMALLQAQAGSLELIRVQWEGKKEISSGEFLNGLRGRGISLPLSCQVL